MLVLISEIAAVKVFSETLPDYFKKKKSLEIPKDFKIAQASIHSAHDSVYYVTVALQYMYAFFN